MSNWDITDEEINAVDTAMEAKNKDPQTVEPIYVEYQERTDLDIQLKDSLLRYVVDESTLTIEKDVITSIDLSFSFEFDGDLKFAMIDGVDTPTTPQAVFGYLIKNASRFAELTQNEFVSEMKDLIQR